MDIPQPEPTILISDLEALKVFSDPMRNQVMEILAPEPLTINQIADKLGLQASKMYYHINLLEKHGFIRVVETIVKGNLIEKRFWLTAYQCKVDHELFNFATPIGRETTITSLVNPIETTREDMVRSLQARIYAIEHGAEEHPREVLVFRELANMTDEQANEFIVRLRALAKEFETHKSNPSRPETHVRALTVAFYPSFYYDEAEGDDT